MPVAYKTYTNIQIDGTPDYVNGATAALDLVESVADGKKILEAICTTAHTVTLRHTDSGNECVALARSAYPLLLIALKDNQATNFKSELNIAIGKAKSGGLTLEHFARQLAMGPTPVTYRSSQNVVRPSVRNPAPVGTSPQAVMYLAGLQTGNAISMLQDLMSGRTPVTSLSAEWRYDLPRLLRPYLTKGRGAGSIVSFNCTRTFYCVDDPAMHLRPPAVALAHELIHALHNARGANMVLVKNKNNENLEEVITTGMPPYNFEEFSDNKFRTQWPQWLELRQNY